MNDCYAAKNELRNFSIKYQTYKERPIIGAKPTDNSAGEQLPVQLSIISKKTKIDTTNPMIVFIVKYPLPHIY